MRHRERVLAALNHEEADRCPMQVSFTPEFAARLRKELCLKESFHNPHGAGNTYQLETALGEDMLITSVGWANSYYANETYAAGRESYTDEWGVGWKNIEYDTRFGRGFYTEICSHPLADHRALDGYMPPDPARPELYLDAEVLLRQFREEYWIVGATVCTVFETAWALRGYAQLMMDLVSDPDLADSILDVPFRYHLHAACKLVEMGVDMIWIGDDVGAQNAMILSPQIWRQFMKPRLAVFVATIKGLNPDLKVAYHTDGCVYPIVPELIEIGIDVLNPIQPRSMDPVTLKERHGHKLCFWGSIDEQYTLPFGTPDEVRDEVLTRLRTLGRNGGLILGPTHHVQLDTPMENFRALVDTIRNVPYRVV